MFPTPDINLCEVIDTNICERVSRLTLEGSIKYHPDVEAESLHSDVLQTSTSKDN